MISLLTSLLIFSHVALAGLPPTTMKGQGDAGAKTTFNFQVPHKQATRINGTTALIETGSGNLLENPGFEAGAHGWDYGPVLGGAVAPTLETNAAEVGNGLKSLTWTPNSAGHYIHTPHVVVPNTLVGTDGLFSCYVKTASTAHKLQVTVGGNVLNEVTITGASEYKLVEVGFTLPATGLAFHGQVSAGDTTVIKLDDCYVGRNTNIGSVAQATFYGEVVWPGTTNCVWSRNSNQSWGSFSADADCTTPATTNIRGAASAPATKIPAGRFLNMPEGEYRFVATGGFQASGGNGCSYRFTDGTVSSEAQTVLSSVSSEVPVIEGRMTLTASADRTVEIQATGTIGASDCYIVASSAMRYLTITAYRFPTAAETVVRANTSAVQWSGYVNGCAGMWGTTSTSYADFGASSGCTLTTTHNQNFGTVTMSSTQPHFSVPFPSTGRYLVCSALNAYGTNSGQIVGTRLTDGTTAISYFGQQDFGALTTSSCDIYSVDSVGTKTLKYQGASAAGGTTTQINATSTYNPHVPGLRMSIVKLDQGFPAPLLVGSVTSNSAGVERAERARISNNGTATITSQSGSWLSVPSRTGAGVMTFTMAGFSETPSCVCDISDAANNNLTCNATPSSATALTTKTNNPPSTATDANISILCVGPK
jgi:hypothetical protein